MRIGVELQDQLGARDCGARLNYVRRREGSVYDHDVDRFVRGGCVCSPLVWNHIMVAADSREHPDRGLRRRTRMRAHDLRCLRLQPGGCWIRRCRCVRRTAGRQDAHDCGYGHDRTQTDEQSQVATSHACIPSPCAVVQPPCELPALNTFCLLNASDGRLVTPREAEVSEVRCQVRLSPADLHPGSPSALGSWVSDRRPTPGSSRDPGDPDSRNAVLGALLEAHLAHRQLLGHGDRVVAVEAGAAELRARQAGARLQAVEREVVQ